jgi:hypothetical protein
MADGTLQSQVAQGTFTGSRFATLTYFWPASVSPLLAVAGRRERGEGHSTADHGDELAGR